MIYIINGEIKGRCDSEYFTVFVMANNDKEAFAEAESIIMDASNMGRKPKLDIEHKIKSLDGKNAYLLDHQYITK